MTKYRNVWMVVPTLRLEVGKSVIKEALGTTGFLCRSVVVEDTVGKGGVKPANMGLREAFDRGATHIVYMNDDVGFPQRGWLERMIEVLDYHPSHAVVGPSGNCLTEPQCYGERFMIPGIQVVEQLSWFFVVVKRVVFEKLGFLNELYFHAGADNELNDRIRAAGWKLIWVKDVYVEHALTSPSTPEGRRMRKHDQELYAARRRGGLI
jgi:GT2 family glycosyltransferase